MKQNGEWNEEAYRKQKAICSKVTSKGLRIALDMKSMTPEAEEAYKDTLRERGESL